MTERSEQQLDKASMPLAAGCGEEEVMAFHSEFKPFGPQPIREQGQWPEFPNPPVWPKGLLGKSFEWRYLGASGQAHAWLVRETGGAGFRFRVSGDRVWTEVDTTPESLGAGTLAKVVTAAIGRAFPGPDFPEPDRQTEIGLWRDDFVQAGVVAP